MTVGVSGSGRQGREDEALMRAIEEATRESDGDRDGVGGTGLQKEAEA